FAMSRRRTQGVRENGERAGIGFLFLTLPCYAPTLFRDRVRRSARDRISSHALANSIPTAAADCGKRLVRVIPGRVFTSRQYGVPSLSSRKSTREKSRSRSARCAANP